MKVCKNRNDFSDYIVVEDGAYVDERNWLCVGRMEDDERELYLEVIDNCYNEPQEIFNEWDKSKDDMIDEAKNDLDGYIEFCLTEVDDVVARVRVIKYTLIKDEREEDYDRYYISNTNREVVLEHIKTVSE